MRDVDKGHGRLEIRTLTATTELTGYLDWPQAQQVMEVVRERQIKGTVQREVAFAITSLSRRKADARRLLALIRGHWRVENGLHHVLDVTFGEDACPARNPNAQMIFAVLNQTAVSLNHLTGCTNQAARVRRFSACPREALKLVKSKLRIE